MKIIFLTIQCKNAPVCVFNVALTIKVRQKCCESQIANEENGGRLSHWSDCKSIIDRKTRENLK